MAGLDPGWRRRAAASGVDLVVPFHQEATTAAATIAEWRAEAERLGVPLRILACEDGSTDGTADVLRALASSGEVEPLIGTERKGYSRAVVDGIRATSAAIVCCVDGDGQCDPNDLGRLLDAPDDLVVVVGARVPRRDPWVRRAMSTSVRLLVRVLHGVDLPDPSCPYVLGDGDTVRRAAGADPVLPQGYWWEFHIRLRHAGVRVGWVPVVHRERLDGETRVYRASKLPGIAWHHLLGLVRLRRG
ncbi:MAG: glycosyltransferase [Acidimicrobiales bacterium]